MPDADDRRARLRELAMLFSRLGATAFGGPAAHIAMMHDEVVERRHWLSDAEFLDLVGATNMIPGPNSTELAIYLGRRRAGWPGLLVAGISFIVPAMAIVLALAWAYVKYGATPQGEALIYGIAPVIIAIVVQALWKLGRTAVKDLFLAAVALAAFVLYLVGVNELVLVFGAGLVVMLVRNARRISPGLLSVGLPTLFLTFLKIGAVLYGSGYVLLAFLRADFVERLGWITERQLLDAVAIGQFTPGPLFTTATFVGYLVLGVRGALLATLAIFLPSFVLVAVTAPWIPRIRSSRWLGAALDGVNAGAVALMAGVTVQLLRDAVVDIPTAALALVAGVALFQFRINSVWLVSVGALAGLAIQAARGAL
jgi:chromate transporter